jgi:streptogramin lyase
MWFAGNEDNMIGRITTTGEYTPFQEAPPQGTHTNTSAVALGSNGRIWFSETNAQKIGWLDACAAP